MIPCGTTQYPREDPMIALSKESSPGGATRCRPGPQRVEDARRRAYGAGTHTPQPIERTRTMGPFFRGDDGLSALRLLLPLAGLACTISPLHAQSLDELYEKAKLEKTVALVAAGPSEPYEHWIREFQQRLSGRHRLLHGWLEQRPQSQASTSRSSTRRWTSDLAIFQTIQDFVALEAPGRAVAVPPARLRPDRPSLQVTRTAPSRP